MSKLTNFENICRSPIYPSSINTDSVCPLSAKNATSRNSNGGIPNNNNSGHDCHCECKCNNTNTTTKPNEENNKCQSKAKSFEYELANGVAALISQSSILCLNCGKNLLKQSKEQLEQDSEATKKIPKHTKMASRDRLGFWGTSGDNEVPGSLSGQDRLHKKRYNKVSKVNFSQKKKIVIKYLQVFV